MFGPMGIFCVTTRRRIIEFTLHRLSASHGDSVRLPDLTVSYHATLLLLPLFVRVRQYDRMCCVYGTSNTSYTGVTLRVEVTRRVTPATWTLNATLTATVR
jgi:hypothetical protein